MISVIGKIPNGLLTTTTPNSNSTSDCHQIIQATTFFTTPRGDCASTNSTDIITSSSKQFKVPLESPTTEANSEIITHASLTFLTKSSEGDEENRGKKAGEPPQIIYYLLGLVRKHHSISQTSLNKYSASLLLLRQQLHQFQTLDTPSSNFEILEKVPILDEGETEVRIHLFPTIQNRSEESDRDTTTQDDDDEVDGRLRLSFRNKILLLSLNQCITLYQIQTLPYSTLCQRRIEILGWEVIGKGFWWAAWDPYHQFLGYAHPRPLTHSGFDDDDDPVIAYPKVNSLLSVLQFHDTYPRESVLNMPLEMNPLSSSLIGTLVTDAQTLSSTSNNHSFKILAHNSGAVYLFQLCSESSQPTSSSTPPIVSEESLLYSVNLLHHNKTLKVEVTIGVDHRALLPLKLDIAVFSQDGYLVVVGWPLFIHILDVGPTHEPSHHMTFPCQSLLPVGPRACDQFLCLSASSSSPSTFLGDEKHDQSAKFGINLIFSDLSSEKLELTSDLLLPLLPKANLKFKLAVIHFLLIHSNDIGVAKRMIYDEGKRRGNLHLKQIYQEFLIAFAYLQTRKQILRNMESFLCIIPYSPNPLLDSSYKGNILTLTGNGAEVSSMLLSPSQRVFPHNVTDLWTNLWQLNRQYSTSHRFNHKNVQEKLLLTFQCYKPEALSRASTPMSPSSPMICTSSVGDIAGLFGRRTTELQLPFVEHESCTANKQEYVFSINLRELSMHLLKERKEWPLHGHTVAGKYVCALVESARILIHLVCLTLELPQSKTHRDKGFKLIDGLKWESRLGLFMLMEHYSLALGTLACPLPTGFTPFFAYLGYRTLQFDRFLWHVRAGTFDLQIDLVKNIMIDLKDSEEGNVAKKLHLISLLPKSRAYRVLNGWSHPMSVCLRARQHSSDLLSGVVSQTRKSLFTTGHKKKKFGESGGGSKERINPMDTFFQLLTAKANVSDIDLGLLTEATMISMKEEVSVTEPQINPHEYLYIPY